MFAGVPVIASNVGGIPEIVINNTIGELFPAGDENELADGILKILLNNDLKSFIIENAAARVQDYFNADRMAGEVLEVYEALMS